MPEVTAIVSLSDFNTHDLITELEGRGERDPNILLSDITDIIKEIYQRRRVGREYQIELDQLIDQALGRIL